MTFPTTIAEGAEPGLDQEVPACSAQCTAEMRSHAVPRRIIRGMDTKPDGLASALIRLGLGPDPGAWAVICSQRAQLLALVRNMVADQEQAEDAVQEALLAVRRDAWQFQPRSCADDRQALAWMQGIAVHAARVQARAAARRQARHRRMLAREANPIVTSPDECCEQQETSSLVRAAVAALPEDQATAISLRFFAQQEYAVIAAATATSEAVVRQRVHRGLIVLRSRLRRVGLALGLTAVLHELRATDRLPAYPLPVILLRPEILTMPRFLTVTGLVAAGLTMGLLLSASGPAGEAPGGGDASAPEVAASLDGRALVVNGQAQVPLGVFGVHAVSETAAAVEDLGIEASRHIMFVPAASTCLMGRKGELNPILAKLPVFIDCQGDRFYPPLPLTNPKWKDQCEDLGRKQGELWKILEGKVAHHGITQWWNEPYLNWAERSACGNGSTLNQQYYDLTKAVEGGPVTIKGWSEPLAHFRWRGLWAVRYSEGKDKKGNPVKNRVLGYAIKLPEGAKEGDTFKARSPRYWQDPKTEYEWTVEKYWLPIDPSLDLAKGHFWSGKQNLDFYRWSFGAWAKALKDVNPKVTVLAGWDFNYDAGDWWMWTEMYRPLLKEFPALIDGITEHHYGIPSERIQAWYEVGTADAWAITGRTLKSWNTECQGMLDPAVYGAAANAGGEESPTKRVHESRYNLGDMIGLIARMPDKVGSRTAHNFAGNLWNQCGAAWALRLLKPLRGDLLAVTSADQRVYLAAARRTDGTIAVAGFNQRPDAVVVALKADADSGVVRRLVLDEATGFLRIQEDAVRPEAGSFRIRLASNEGMLLLAQGLKSGSQAMVERLQFHAAEGTIHRPVSGKPLALSIAVPAAALTGASAASLRLVTDGAEGMVIRLNGQPVPFARILPVTDVEIPLDRLVAGPNKLEADLPEKSLLGAASIVVERVRSGR